MRDISLLVGCSENKIVYWMKKYNIPRRTWSEATYVKSNPDGDPYKIKQLITVKDYLLYGLAMGIFWGEGTKRTPYSVRITNTDKNMIVVFRRFLRQVCQVKESKISYSIVCFNDSSPQDARNYWAKALEISPEKFGKITQIAKQGKGSYKRKSLYGVCTMQISNYKLKSWIDEQLAEIVR